MPSEYILLERLEKNKYYVRLSFEIPDNKPNALDGIDILSITLLESLRSGSPHLLLKLGDMNGNLFKDQVILPSYTFIFRIGKTKEDAIESRYQFSNMELIPTATNSRDSLVLNVTLITDHWDDLFKKKLSRSWASKKISDVVADVAEGLGFRTIDIEPTFGIDNYIQPYWSNSDFMVWLSRRAVNARGIAGYQYAHLYDNSFLFKSYDGLYAVPPKKKLVYSPLADRDDGFMTFNVKNEYLGNVMYGATGVEYGYFDFSKKQYISSYSDVTRAHERQLSDWYFIDEKQLSPSIFLDGGRDVKTDDVAEGRVLVQANTIHTADLVCHGDPTLHIGDVVDILLPNLNRTDKQLSVNEFYSGYWLIWKIQHIIDTKSGLFSSKLFISRSGLNGVEIDGLVRTETGKNIR